jgi:AbrB family looped-hinge helix DNA binding protein
MPTRTILKVKEKRELTKVGGSFRITIPAYMVRGLDWQEGDVLSIEAVNDEIVIKREGKKSGT